MWMALDIFIGLALCYALVSLFCSVIQEFIAQALDSRGKLLVEALKGAQLGPLIDKAAGRVVKNPGWLFRIPGLTKWGSAVLPGGWRKTLNDGLDKLTGGRRLPHDISPANLAEALLDGTRLLANGKVEQQFDATVQSMNLPKGLESRLLNLSAAARANVDTVKQEIEKWFGDFMDQIQHWYIRRAQAMSMVIGLAVALCLNIDTIAIAKLLYQQPAKREAVVKLAEKVDAQGKSAICADDAGKKGDVKACLNELEAVFPFDIGWKYTEAAKQAGVFGKLRFVWNQLWADGSLKFLGLLLTGLALSLSARFWFDMLKNLVALRTGGQPADKKSAA